MLESQNNYERIARFYDPLTKLISFGGNERTQDFFLKEVEKGNSVLVAGCGSVDFSVKLAKIGASVTCLDISPTMLEILQTKARKVGVDHDMEFVCCNILDFERRSSFDCVSVNYFLNVFDYQTMVKVLRHVSSLLKAEGKLFLADEVKADKMIMRLIQKIVRPIVYRTHHLLVNNNLHDIYDYLNLLKSHEFEILERTIDKSRCMQSIVGRKIKGI